jgi:hypothetical protein
MRLTLAAALATALTLASAAAADGHEAHAVPLARPGASDSIDYKTRTDHSEALIVRGMGYNVDPLDQPRAMARSGAADEVGSGASASRPVPTQPTSRRARDLPAAQRTAPRPRGRAQSDRGGKFGGQPPPAPPAPADACPQYHTGRKQYDPSGSISPGR